MGNLTGSRFTLKVSLRYAPEPGETDFLCELFRIASGILSDATDGKLSIGQVDISPDSTGGADADVWIHPGDSEWPNSTGARLWYPGESFDFAQAYLMYPTVLVHELGHYLFGLRDEYASGAKCVGKVTQQASIMESYGWGFYTCWVDSFGDGFFDWPSFFGAYTTRSAQFRTGQPTEFCFAGNHNATSLHPQNSANAKQSCWTYMTNDANHNGIPYGLALPPASGPRKRKPAAPAPPVCVEIQGAERDLLILGPKDPGIGVEDRIGPGASFWIDTAQPGDQLAVTSGTGEPTIAPTFSTVPFDADAREVWRRSLREQVLGREPESVRPDPEGIRNRLLDVARPGRAANQQAILVATWLSAADVESVLRTVPDLQEAGTRLHVVARGDEPHLGLLAQAALVTSGSLVTTTGAGAEHRLADLSAGLIALAAQTRENAAPLPGPSTIAESATRAARPSVRFEVDVSRGSSLVTLGAAWDASVPTPRVEVIAPDGVVVAPGSQAAAARRSAVAPPYSVAQIEGPEAGRWSVLVSGRGVRSDTVRLIASEVNDRVRLDATVRHAHIRVGEPIELRARLRAPTPLPGVTVSGRVLTPAGDAYEVGFREHSGVGDDPFEAGTYTATFEETRIPGAYAIEIEASRRRGRVRSPLDEYYAGRPGIAPKRLVPTATVPENHRRAVMTAVADAEGRTERDPVAGYNPRARSMTGIS